MFLFIGERRSPTAIKRDVYWEDEALAAKPLFEALRAIGLDPHKQHYTNWFEEIGPAITRAHDGPRIALGQKVQKALACENISFTPLIHPAARGSIRLRANYIAHVATTLGPLIGLSPRSIRRLLRQLDNNRLATEPPVKIASQFLPTHSQPVNTAARMAIGLKIKPTKTTHTHSEGGSE